MPWWHAVKYEWLQNIRGGCSIVLPTQGIFILFCCFFFFSSLLEHYRDIFTKTFIWTYKAFITSKKAKQAESGVHRELNHAAKEPVFLWNVCILVQLQAGFRHRSVKTLLLELKAALWCLASGGNCVHFSISNLPAGLNTGHQVKGENNYNSNK